MFNTSYLYLQSACNEFLRVEWRRVQLHLYYIGKWITNWLNTTYWKDVVCYKARVHICIWIRFEISFLVHWPFSQSFCQFILLITLFYFKSYLIDKVLYTSFSSLRLTAILPPSHFHINFRISLSVFIKPAGIFGFFEYIHYINSLNLERTNIFVIPSFLMKTYLLSSAFDNVYGFLYRGLHLLLSLFLGIWCF